jgi:hypothetical protein
MHHRAIGCLSCKHDVEGYAEYWKKEHDTWFILGWYLDSCNASEPNSIIIHNSVQIADRYAAGDGKF